MGVLLQICKYPHGVCVGETLSLSSSSRSSAAS